LNKKTKCQPVTNEYIYSSAKDYADEDGMPEMIKIVRTWKKIK